MERLAALLLTAALALCAGCSSSTEEAPVMDKEFALDYGEQKTLQDEELSLEFSGLTDHRCPTGRICAAVYAGAVTVTLTVAWPDSAPAELKLNYPGNANEPREAIYGPYRVQLVAVAPDAPAEGAEYTVTLLVTDGLAHPQ